MKKDYQHKFYFSENLKLCRSGEYDMGRTPMFESFAEVSEDYWGYKPRTKAMFEFCRNEMLPYETLNYVLKERSRLRDETLFQGNSIRRIRKIIKVFRRKSGKKRWDAGNLAIVLGEIEYEINKITLDLERL